MPLKMKYNSTILLFGLMTLYAQAGKAPTALTVEYQSEITLGQFSSVPVAPPRGVFFALSEVFYAPNGTSSISYQTGNAFGNTPPYNVTNGIIEPSINETCIERDVWTSRELTTTNSTHRPDSVGTGWAYSFTLILYYSANSNYRYFTDSGKEMVCITSPYISEQLKTDIYNVTVKAAENGVTTTSYSQSPTGTPSSDQGLPPLKDWPLSPSPTGQSFANAGSTLSIPCMALLPLMLAIFHLLM